MEDVTSKTNVKLKKREDKPLPKNLPTMKNYLINRALEAEKKLFVTVTLFVATATVANATGLRQNDNPDPNQAVMNQQAQNVEQTDVYREHVLNEEENDKHIVRFYDIERIVVENKHHATIRIYNDKWQLIEQTNSDVDKPVRQGNYYITSTSHIKGSYIQ